MHHQNQNQSMNPSLFPEHEHLNCPRCGSTNTKFCYYNNYNLSQPRHYCKNCRRYWTKGGTLRKIPVGGAIRKKRSSSSSDDNKHPATNSSPATTAPPAQMKAEPSQIIRFSNDQRLSLRDGSEDGGMSETPATVSGGGGNNNNNNNKNDTGWTNLSIFTSGSNFN